MIEDSSVKNSIKLGILWTFMILNNNNNFKRFLLFKKKISLFTIIFFLKSIQLLMIDIYTIFISKMNGKFLYFIMNKRIIFNRLKTIKLESRIKIAEWYKNQENFKLLFWKYYDVSNGAVFGKKCSIKRFRESSRMLSLAVSTILINRTDSCQ